MNSGTICAVVTIKARGDLPRRHYPDGTPTARQCEPTTGACHLVRCKRAPAITPVDPRLHTGHLATPFIRRHATCKRRTKCFGNLLRDESSGRVRGKTDQNFLNGICAADRCAKGDDAIARAEVQRGRRIGFAVYIPMGNYIDARRSDRCDFSIRLTESRFC